jgi:purine-binding chemotaxis protein CheW
MHALVFGVGDEWYAIDTTAAREVVAHPDVSSLPTAPPNVAGVFNLRGEIVPVFDTAILLGLTSQATSTAYVVVVETPLGPAGLAASTMGDAVTLGEPVGETELPGTIGAFDVDRRVVVLLDVAVLLSPANLAA